nr:TPA: Mas-related G protein-coupled receptor G2 [Erinaceus europaeus]
MAPESRIYTAVLSSPDSRNGTESPTVRNGSWNSTPSPDKEQFQPYYDYTTSLVIVVIGFCGSVGNLSVIWTLGFCMKKNPISLYKLHLACADFICLLFNSVWFILYLLDHSNNVFHILIRAVRNSSFMVAVCLLMVLNTERCVYVLWAFWYRCHRPVHLSTILSAIIWGLAFCIGTLTFLCDYSKVFSCYRIDFVCCIIVFFTSLGLCVSGVTLLIWVQCCSWRKQPTWFYTTTLLRMLAFLLLGLPAGLGFMVYLLLPSLPYKHILLPIFYLLLVLNSTMNPIIYFFVGRHR